MDTIKTDKAQSWVGEVSENLSHPKTAKKKAWPATLPSTASQKSLGKKCSAPKHCQAYEQDFGLLQHRTIHIAEQQVSKQVFKIDYAEYHILQA